MRFPTSGMVSYVTTPTNKRLFARHCGGSELAPVDDERALGPKAGVMIMPIHPSNQTTYSPDELVQMRRMLLTAGQYVECPRCSSDVTFAYTGARSGNKTYYVLQCSSCGCSVTVADLPEGVLP